MPSNIVLLSITCWNYVPIWSKNVKVTCLIQTLSWCSSQIIMALVLFPVLSQPTYFWAILISTLTLSISKCTFQELSPANYICKLTATDRSLNKKWNPLTWCTSVSLHCLSLSFITKKICKVQFKVWDQCLGGSFWLYIYPVIVGPY